MVPGCFVYTLSKESTNVVCWHPLKTHPGETGELTQFSDKRREGFFPPPHIYPCSIYVLTPWEYLGSLVHVFLSEKMQLTNPAEMSLFVSFFCWIRGWNLFTKGQDEHQSWLRGVAFQRQQAIGLVQSILSDCTLHQTKHHVVKHNSAL